MLHYNNLFLLSILLALTAGCSKKTENVSGSKAPVRVETVTVNETGITAAPSFSGTIQEDEGADLSFSIPGTITGFNLHPGDKVAKGQIIARVDDSSLKNAYEIANATLAQANDAYNRMKILHDSNSLPEIKWVDVQQKLIQAQNAMEIARNALDDANLHAPFSGIVAEKYSDVGQVAVPGVPIVKIINIAKVKAVITVPQNCINDFHVGDRAVITIDDDKEHTLSGILVEKGVSANPLSRTYEIKYSIGNSDRLLPGMICNVAVENNGRDEAIILPYQAVLLDEHNNNFVWLDSAGIARKRIVQISADNNAGLEITAGLNPGDKVIVKGQQKVCNGTRIESINN